MEGEEISDKCTQHSKMEDRVCKLEDAMVEIRNELKTKAITDARIEKSMEIMAQTLTLVQSDTSGMRDGMIKLVAETLEKTRTDMSSLIKSNTIDNEKDREWQRHSEEVDKRFYRKLIIACFSVLSTITLSYFGIKAVISIFGE